MNLVILAGELLILLILVILVILANLANPNFVTQSSTGLSHLFCFHKLVLYSMLYSKLESYLESPNETQNPVLRSDPMKKVVLKVNDPIDTLPLVFSFPTAKTLLTLTFQ